MFALRSSGSSVCSLELTHRFVHLVFFFLPSSSLFSIKCTAPAGVSSCLAPVTNIYVTTLKTLPVLRYNEKMCRYVLTRQSLLNIIIYVVKRKAKLKTMSPPKKMKLCIVVLYMWRSVRLMFLNTILGTGYCLYLIYERTNTDTPYSCVAWLQEP